jgi:fatty acid desaturase
MKSDVEIRQAVADLRKDQRNLHGMAHILSTYLFLALGLWLLKTSPNWWTGVFCFFLLGFMQYRLVMSAHEAVHKTLLFPAWLNEAAGVFHAALVGISFFNYRKTHLEHHKNPQSIEDDIDGYIYRPLLKCKPGWKRFGLLVFGVLVDIFEKVKRKLKGAQRVSTQEKIENASSLSSQTLPILLAQAGLFAFFTWYLSWWHYFVFWVTPVLLVALSLDRARTFLEHGYQFIFSDQKLEDLRQAPQTTIDVQTNALERYLFAPYGFAHHQAHHAYLTVPFYNLPKVVQLLERKDPAYFHRVKGSYVTILFKMIWADK